MRSHINTVAFVFFFNQSLSDEDSFKKMSLTTEVLKKIEDLLISLMERQVLRA